MHARQKTAFLTGNRRPGTLWVWRTPYSQRSYLPPMTTFRRSVIIFRSAIWRRRRRRWAIGLSITSPSRDAVDNKTGGRQRYFAIARVASIVPDFSRPDHFHAVIEPGSYMNFVSPVPFQIDGDYFENRARREDGGTSKGWFGWSVRPIPPKEFERIVQFGMAMQLRPYERPDVPAYGLAEEAAPYEAERPIIEQTISRPYRDQAFRRIVRDAYDNRCAISGLRLLNGGGRPEVQAAHIKAVEDRGPDSVRNGLALSGTFHWLFDRGHISVDKDFKILRRRANSGGITAVVPTRRNAAPPGRSTFVAARPIHAPPSRESLQGLVVSEAIHPSPARGRGWQAEPDG